MTGPDFIDRLVEFGGFLANLLVFVLTVTAYQRTRKRCLLLLGISAAMGAVLAAAPWIRPDAPSWTFWVFGTAATLCDLTLWVIGIRLLVQEYADLVARIAQPRTAPSGVPVTPADDLGVKEGPPAAN